MLKLPLVTDRRYYVSLGDTQSGNNNGQIGAASRFYDQLAARDPAFRMIPLAIDGATIATVRFVQMPRLAEMSVAPFIVTLTLGTGQLLQLASGEANLVCETLQTHGSVVLRSLQALLARNATVMLTTLYDPLDGNDPRLAAGIAQFNDTLRHLATQHNATIADIHQAFLGHGRNAGDPFAEPNNVTNDELYLCAGPGFVPVPNEHGAEVFAGVLLAAYEAGLTEETPLVSDFTTGGAPL